MRTILACFTVTIGGGFMLASPSIARAPLSVERGVHKRYAAVAFDSFVLFNPEYVVSAADRIAPGKGREFTNLVIGGVLGTAERQWPGAILRLPDVAIRVADLRGRCVMTTYDPDTTEQDSDVLRDIVRRFGGRLCLNATVTRAGRVEIGNSVELMSSR